MGKEHSCRMCGRKAPRSELAKGTDERRRVAYVCWSHLRAALMAAAAKVRKEQAHG